MSEKATKIVNWHSRDLKGYSLIYPPTNIAASSSTESPAKDIEPMGKKLYPTDTLKQAQAILSAWKLIDPALKIGTLTPEAIKRDLATVKGLQEKIIHLQKELLVIRSQRDTTSISLRNNVK